MCGKEGPLTFEHVPPRAAFNNRPIVLSTFEALMGLDLEAPIKGRTQQRGSGDFTLCQPCNNQTGLWYGNAFVHWTYQGMRILLAAKGEPRLVYPIHAMPLKVLKQVVTMFMSVNAPSFQAGHPELVRFVLNRQARYLPPKYRFFVYFNLSARFRHLGLSGIIRFGGEDVSLSEISFAPFGYVMTIDSPPPDERLCEITHFARYGAQEFTDVNLAIQALPIVTPMVGDYRSVKEVRATEEENLQYMREANLRRQQDSNKKG
ncbi:hypothetical protein BO221_50395 [Archangium sp. Cb G35]|uniref:hypothetical protein n=1 Tax=Archangium sp. Cb G35 TaxID=1920190 RepID=UPI0009369846|nr:hypothetical protein [Archangium sp. Cb G35]OJT16413.1 hypothetical protein BO221_50395 [Archangium sp. Cb G35]